MLRASGELGVASGDALLHAACALLDEHDELEVDVTGVSFINSGGVRALCEIQLAARQRDRRVFLRAAPALEELLLAMRPAAVLPGSARRRVGKWLLPALLTLLVLVALVTVVA